MNLIYGKNSIRGQNRLLILNLIRQHGNISRVDLANETGLSTAALTNITAQLLDLELIREVGLGESSQGRRPVLLELNHEARHIIGVDVGRISIRSCVSDLNGNVLACNTNDFDLQNDWQSMHQVIVKQVTELQNELHNLSSPIAGIGVVTPGNPNFQTTANYAKKHSIPIDFAPPRINSFVQKNTGIPTIVANATDGAALAESWFGIAKHVESIIYLTIGTGVKASLVFHGQLYPHLDGFTQEFGHTTIDVNGPECWCGNCGCLELYTSKDAIIQYANEAKKAYTPSVLEKYSSIHNGELTVNQIFKAAKENDTAAKKALAKLAKYLGAGAVNLVNLYNPDLILIGTREMPVEDLHLLVEPIQRIIRKRCLPTSSKAARVGIGSFGDNAYMMGAVTIVVKELFTPSSTPSFFID